MPWVFQKNLREKVLKTNVYVQILLLENAIDETCLCNISDLRKIKAIGGRSSGHLPNSIHSSICWFPYLCSFQYGLAFFSAHKDCWDMNMTPKKAKQTVIITGSTGAPLPGKNTFPWKSHRKFFPEIRIYPLIAIDLSDWTQERERKDIQTYTWYPSHKQRHQQLESNDCRYTRHFLSHGFTNIDTHTHTHTHTDRHRHRHRHTQTHKHTHTHTYRQTHTHTHTHTQTFTHTH